jgi:hypothetical protein
MTAWPIDHSKRGHLLILSSYSAVRKSTQHQRFIWRRLTPSWALLLPPKTALTRSSTYFIVCCSHAEDLVEYSKPEGMAKSLHERAWLPEELDGADTAPNMYPHFSCQLPIPRIYIGLEWEPLLNHWMFREHHISPKSAIHKKQKQGKWRLWTSITERQQNSRMGKNSQYLKIYTSLWLSHTVNLSFLYSKT